MRVSKVSIHFNSIKVQLKLDQLYLGLKYFARFQFHKGTIKACFAIWQCRSLNLFQFHKGTIKAPQLQM